MRQIGSCVARSDAGTAACRPSGHGVLVGDGDLSPPAAVSVDGRPGAAAVVAFAAPAADVTRPRRGRCRTVDRPLQRRSMAHFGNHTGDSSISVSCRGYAMAYNVLFGLRFTARHQTCPDLGISQYYPAGVTMSTIDAGCGARLERIIFCLCQIWTLFISHSWFIAPGKSRKVPSHQANTGSSLRANTPGEPEIRNNPF